MSVTSRNAGEIAGERIDGFVLASDTGVEVDIITWGVVVRDWRVPVHGGRRSVVLGFEDVAAYPAHSPHFGAVTGRVANRIAGAEFDLDGTRYPLPVNWRSHTLHGGERGLGRLVWQAEPDSSANAIRFTHLSRHGEMGFPGTVRFTATYRLTGNRLTLDMHAEADRRTPISLVQHHYFNLGLGPDVLGHRYRIDAPAFTEPGADLIPTGAILPVAGTQYDLRSERGLRDAEQRPLSYDVNLVLASGREPHEPAAEVTSPDADLMLRLWTDRPGLQFYNSVYTDVSVPGLAGRRYGAYSGFCLEDQAFPGALHHPHFPSIIHGPGNDYRHRCEIEIAPP